MAITKTHPIKSTLKAAIAYICNPAKTDGKLLVSTYGCNADTADIEFGWTRRHAIDRGYNYNLGRHLIQAFSPGEVSPEEAHEIGMQLAKEILGGKYEFVLTTHVDKGHIHNHVIWNAVSFVDHKHYHSNKRSYHFIRRTSDRLCQEHGLSVIVPGQDKGKSYIEHSFYAKALAIKRVTENKGKRTSGVDHEIWESPEYKFKAIDKLTRRGYRAQPLRRVYIEKKNGKLRPLSIPTMTDRAMQTLYRFALEPVAETTADIHSYGFRPQRCVQDAIERCFQVLSKKRSPVWILEGDIKGCFDNISHDWIMNNIPMDKVILHQFLKSGYMETGTLFPTEMGTPQGGTISTTICNMVLDGLEPILKEHFKPKWVDGKNFYSAVNYTRYADDFIITGKDPAVLENEVKPIVRQFLEERGLTLSEEKTLITHIEDGFDFLGCNVRKYSGKLLIKPAKSSVKSFLRKIRGIIRQNKTATQQDLIARLNPVIRGWVNFHRFNVSDRIFGYVDAQIFHALWRWAKRRHHNKGSKWIVRKYFHRINTRNWTFARQWKRDDGTTGYFALEYASDTKIVRFPGIRDGANPHDEEWRLYLEERETEKMRITVKGNHTLRYLFNKQRGCCALCGEKLTLETGGRCHKYKHGNASLNFLVHPDCHRKLHQFDSFQPVHCGSNGL